MQESRLRSEVGSEFDINWPPSQRSAKETCISSIFNFWGKDNILLLSGRTAIDCICRDIKAIGSARKVYMPAYCCSSMIAPFIRNGMSIEFYDVYYDGAQLTFDVHDDLSIEILYLNNYFGFKSYLDIEWIKRKQSEGTIVIYDKTHSLFLQNDLYLQVADYAFCSVRKWFAVASGAILSKRNGDFIDFNLRDCGYVQTKLNAQILKSRYLAGDISVSKEMFYPAFADFSHHLEDDYADYKMDGQSISLLKSMNISDIIARRRANAKMLYSELKGINHVQFLFSDLDDDTIPLFVPIIASTQDIREIIRRELIARQIYCPVHWPRNSMISSKLKVNKIYDQEISLICDQRYTPQQLEGIIQTIKNINI